MQEKAGRKLNIMLRIALILLMLTLVSIYLASGIFARYVSENSGNSDANTAKFAPMAEFTNADWWYDPDSEMKTFDYNLKLTNLSEVDVRYDMTITFPDDVLDGAEFKFDGNKQTVDHETPLHYSNIAEVAPNDMTTRTISLTISEDCYNKMAAKYNVSKLTAFFDADITVSQID